MSHFTHFKAILITILSFYFSSSLMGMESAELQKLLLFKNADLIDENGKTLPKEINKEIITKTEYFLLLKSKSSMPNNISMQNIANLHDENRIKQYKGVRLYTTDLDLITINDEEEKSFKRLLSVIPHKNSNGIFEHLYTANSVTNITNLELCAQDPEDPQLRTLAGDTYNLLLPHEYNKILKLPLNLRRKVGELSTVKVVGKEQVSFDARLDAMVPKAILGTGTGYLGGAVYYYAYIGPRYNEVLAMPIKSLEDLVLFNSRYKELNSILPSILKVLILGLGCGATLGAIAGAIIARDEPQDRVFNVEEKPLITSEEQDAIKKTERAKIARETAALARREYDAYINKQCKFLTEPYYKLDNDWKKQLKPKPLTIEKF